MRHPIGEIAELEPDYMGFIFWNASKRYFTGAPESLPAGVLKAGVFVDASPDEVLHLTALYGLDVIQLHGTESPSYLARLKARMHSEGHTKTRYIKAFPVGPGFDFVILQAYVELTNFFLFDTRGELPGGNGRRFDWTLLADYPFDTDFFLSGGIGLGHLEEIKKLGESSIGARIHAVDINSGFESSPGVKVTEWVRKFKEGLQKPPVANTK